MKNRCGSRSEERSPVSCDVYLCSAHPLARSEGGIGRFDFGVPERLSYVGRSRASMVSHLRIPVQVHHVTVGPLTIVMLGYPLPCPRNQRHICRRKTRIVCVLSQDQPYVHPVPTLHLSCRRKKFSIKRRQCSSLVRWATLPQHLSSLDTL